MLDPAIIQDLHRAMVPPTVMPPAIERASSSTAEASDRTLEQFMDRAEADSVEWRASLKRWADALDAGRDRLGDDDQLAELDRRVDDMVHRARVLRRGADRRLKRRGRMRERVKVVDPSAARAIWAQAIRMHHLELENSEAVRRLAASLGNHRDRIDTRGPPEFHPNAETIAAMREARAGIGMRRTASVADLMAELNAEGD